jgi:hypothetical protein
MTVFVFLFLQSGLKVKMPSDAKKKREQKKKEAAKRGKKQQATEDVANGDAETNGKEQNGVSNGATDGKLSYKIII